MSNQIALPNLGENIESGDVLSILVSEGDTVKENQDLIEVETDKATMPVPSPSAGKIVKILISEGDTVKVGAPLMEIEAGSASGNGAAAKEEKPTDGGVAYGPGAERFAGATYDPVSHYRAAAVFDFFEREGLTPELLRAVSQRQMRLLVELCGEWPIPYRVQFPRPRVELDALAGFLALRTPLAPVLVRLLRERRVFVDHRGDILRIGPAPYVRDDQLAEAVSRLATLLAEG